MKLEHPPFCNAPLSDRNTQHAATNSGVEFVMPTMTKASYLPRTVL